MVAKITSKLMNKALKQAKKHGVDSDAFNEMVNVDSINALTETINDNFVLMKTKTDIIQDNQCEFGLFLEKILDNQKEIMRELGNLEKFKRPTQKEIDKARK